MANREQRTEKDRAEVQRRTLRTLMIGLLPAGAAMSAGYSAAAVLGEELTGSEWLGGLAAAAMTVGGAISALPLARLMARKGRRPGLTYGYMVACVGAGCGASAALFHFYPLLVLGLLGIGCGNATNLAARFAAADLAEDDSRAKAIGGLVWASTFGTVLGPSIGLGPAQAIAGKIGADPLLGPYLLCGVFFGLAATIIWRRLIPDPLLLSGITLEPTLDSNLRSAGAALYKSPATAIAIAAMMVAHAVMVGLMTMTPLHLRDGNHELQVVGLVISFHVIGMYALSPVIGWAADRLGTLKVLLLGGLLLFGGAEIASHTNPEDSLGLFVGLFLIGLGWSCCLISGSAIIVSDSPSPLRVQIQGLADLLMTSSGAIAGLSSGLIVSFTNFHTLSHWGGLLSLLPAGVIVLRITLKRSGQPSRR